jgi:hypothetical protein
VHAYVNQQAILKVVQAQQQQRAAAATHLEQNSSHV